MTDAPLALESAFARELALPETPPQSVARQEPRTNGFNFQIETTDQVLEELLIQIAQMWSATMPGEATRNRVEWLKARKRNLVLAYHGQELAGYTILTPLAGIIEQKLAKAPKSIAQIASQLLRLLPKVYGLSEILVAPQFRRQGLARQLAEFGLKELKPDLLIGQTKNPAAVWGQAVTVTSSHRTFFGDFEILPGDNLPISRLRRKGLQILFSLTIGTPPYKDDLYQVPPNHLPPEVPDVSRFDPSVQKAFANLIAAQEQVGDQTTLVKPLISVRRGK